VEYLVAGGVFKRMAYPTERSVEKVKRIKQQTC
jgi:hypothetical protein